MDTLTSFAAGKPGESLDFGKMFALDSSRERGARKGGPSDCSGLFWPPNVDFEYLGRCCGELFFIAPGLRRDFLPLGLVPVCVEMDMMCHASLRSAGLAGNAEASCRRGLRAPSTIVHGASYWKDVPERTCQTINLAHAKLQADGEAQVDIKEGGDTTDQDIVASISIR